MIRLILAVFVISTGCKSKIASLDERVSSSDETTTRDDASLDKNTDVIDNASEKIALEAPLIYSAVSNATGVCCGR